MMRSWVLGGLVIVSTCGAASAQQSYAGRQQASVVACLDRAQADFAAKNVSPSDFPVLSVSRCDEPIRAYRDFIIAFEKKAGTSPADAETRATAAMAVIFGNASDRYKAQMRKGSETPGDPRITVSSAV